MDYLRGYKVFRDDPQWTSKIMVGSVLALSTMFVPILGQVALTGWQALMMRRAVQGETEPMPRLDLDFDYLGKLVGVGFKGFIARFLWTLPLVAVFFVLAFCGYFGFVALVIGAASSGEPALGAFVPCCVGLSMLVLVPVMALAMIPAQVAGMRAELADDLDAGLKFREVMEVTRGMFRELFFGTLILWIVGFGLAMVGMLACYVGVFPVMVLGMIAQAHMMAQIYSRWLERGGEALPLGPTEIASPPAQPMGGGPQG